MAPQLAFLGLGAMGQGITKNLILKGNLENPLILWNRTTQVAVDHSIDVGHSLVLETIEQVLARASIIWSCFSGEAAVLETFETILQHNLKGKLFIECSTITAEGTNIISERIIAAGGEFVAMPVFGEPGMAEAALLTCLPAGKKEPVQHVLPYLKGVIGRAVIDLSDQNPGFASHMKLLGNVLIVQMIESVAEAHVLAEKTGLGSSYLHQLIESIWGGAYSIYSERMRSGNYYTQQPIVNVSMARDVASHVLALAEHSGTELKAYKISAHHLDDVQKQAGKDGDISGIYGAVRQESGLPFER
ncbi:NAD(P)-binding protein [Viridothelium virens]|uniref:NAD(P)-binding protein n=1 Tax=Viridothelium virens TaxID=1048519 RepID=A0A6A6H957_VIRVR|nr:NAD(P)-binding protein [Viridothelium virens]